MESFELKDSSESFVPIKQRKMIDLSLPVEKFGADFRLPRINLNRTYDTLIEEKTRELDYSQEHENAVDQSRLHSALRSSVFMRKDSSVSLISSSESADETIDDDFITFDNQFDEQEEEEDSIQDEEETIEDDKQVQLWKRSVKLTAKEEKEIERTVRKECMDDFRKIMDEARDKQVKIKKHFKKVIEEARKMLVTARVQAEISSVSKLEEIAEQRQEEIYTEREKRKAQLRKASDPASAETITYKEFVKSRVTEMDTLRKLQSNLDRARARRRNSIAAGATVDKNGNVDFKKLAAMELRRLERVKDIQTLVDELTAIGLEDKALELQNTLRNKSDFETTFTREIINEKKKARNYANRRKQEEMEKLRRNKLFEKYTEKERLERERREREERERQRRIAEAIKRREFNLKMKQLYNETKIETSISRPYSFSYFKSK